jgi:hypothetical protein
MNTKINAILKTKKFPSGNRLDLVLNYAHYAGFKPGYQLELHYLDYSHDEGGKKIYNSCNTQHFKLQDLEQAEAMFDLRIKSENAFAIPRDHQFGHRVEDVYELEPRDAGNTYEPGSLGDILFEALTKRNQPTS